ARRKPGRVQQQHHHAHVAHEKGEVQPSHVSEHVMHEQTARREAVVVVAEPVVLLQLKNLAMKLPIHEAEYFTTYFTEEVQFQHELRVHQCVVKVVPEQV